VCDGNLTKAENGASNDLLQKFIAQARRQILYHYYTSKADSDSLTVYPSCKLAIVWNVLFSILQSRPCWNNIRFSKLWRNFYAI